MGKGGVELNFDYFCSRRGIACSLVTLFSAMLFILLHITSNTSGVYMWLGYVSFTYSLVGIYLAVHSLISSIDSTTTVFSVLYYGSGSIFFLAGGVGVLSKGYDGFLSLLIGSFSLVLGTLMSAFTLCGSKM
ncbi:uncharacterized protein [Dermacentor albipictus]|uniref:uncharacterized protein isoform X2 n=1 Tax=Dermacentor albipictus TaxID=60249 RepID=UPI0038FC3CCA